MCNNVLIKPTYQMQCWAYAGNPNALYSVDELKYYVDRTKHTVSPAYSPTVACECPHIKCTVGRMQGIRLLCISNELH